MRYTVCSLLLATLLLLLAQSAAAVQEIKVMGLFKNKAIVEIDGKRRVLSAGKPSKEGIKLISANSEAAVIEIAGQRDTYRIGTSTSLRTDFKKPGPKAAVQIYPDVSGMYSINGGINGFPLRFLVDTGATLVAINENEAKRIGLDYKLKGTVGQATTASGVAKAYYITLERVKVGAIELLDVAGVVLQGGHPSVALLGNSFLGRLDMSREGKVMVITQD